MSGAFTRALESGFVFLDGSMGAVLQSISFGGGPRWKIPEELNLTHPDSSARFTPNISTREPR